MFFHLSIAPTRTSEDEITKSKQRIYNSLKEKQEEDQKDFWEKTQKDTRRKIVAQNPKKEWGKWEHDKFL